MAIGTTAAIIGASAVGGLAQSQAAGQAADAQTAAANASLDLQQQMFEQSREDLEPYRNSGIPAVNALNYYLGIGPRPDMIGGTPANITTIPGAMVGGGAPASGGIGPGRMWGDPGAAGGPSGGTMSPERYAVGDQVFDTLEQAQAFAASNQQGGTPFVGFQETPGFRFALDEGLGAVEASAAARGGLFSGAAMQALQQRGNDLANLEFGNYLSRLEGTATRGQNAAAQSATVNTNNAQMGTNALSAIGNAQAAGAIGQGNAFNSAINNGIGLFQYQNMLNRFPGA